eukprot:364088-Chlamydomonas_euryale.AAC.10
MLKCPPPPEKETQLRRHAAGRPAPHPTEVCPHPREAQLQSPCPLPSSRNRPAAVWQTAAAVCSRHCTKGGSRSDDFHSPGEA